MRPMPVLLMVGALGAALLAAPEPVVATPDGAHRWSGQVRGAIALTGNTLGLGKATGSTGLGTQDSIGLFAAGDDTTLDWQQNSSTAVLDLPPGAHVEHAELVWGGSVTYGGQDVSASLDVDVQLGHGAVTTAVSPDPTTALTLNQTDADGSTAVRFYRRSSDVTSFVESRGDGTYRVGGVPATNAAMANTLNAAGWSLAVVWTHPDAPNRYVALDVPTEAGWVDAENVHDAAYAGFCTPDAVPPAGSLVVSAVEGDANRTGDQLLAGADTESLTAVDGPGNLADNLFASQINDSDGVLDTRGSHADANHDAAAAQNVVGGRQGWDVTTLDLTTDHLGSGQDGLAVRARTSGDSYLPLLLGAQIGIGAPHPEPDGLDLVESSVPVGGSTSLTAVFDNSDGTADAHGVGLALDLPPEVSVGAITVDGTPVSVTDLEDGSAIGDVPVGTSRVVEAVVTGTTAGTHHLSPTWSWESAMCSTSPLEPAAFTPDRVTLRVSEPDTTPPGTRITRHPAKRGTARSVTFGFRSTEPGSTFTCRWDSQPPSTCTSPDRRRVGPGNHTFRVWSTDAAGNRDASPARFGFRVSRSGR